MSDLLVAVVDFTSDTQAEDLSALVALLGDRYRLDYNHDPGEEVADLYIFDEGGDDA